MRTKIERLDIKLTNAEIFAICMEANGFTVRTLAEAVEVVLIRKRSKAKISKSTIGNLRSGARSTVNKDVAAALAELLHQEQSALFTPKVTTVTRDVPKNGAKK